MIRRTATRRGATLVEMLVAAALCILGMWLMTWVYQQGTDSFRFGRAQAELTAQQRMVTTLLTRDLKADHFLLEDNKPNGGRRLSDQHMHLVNARGYTPPRAGYFRAGSFPAPTLPNDFAPYSTNANVLEGSDTVNYSTRSVNHFLQFTVILPGGSNAQIFSSEVPAGGGQANQYFSTVAEVTYFLQPAGNTPSGVPLFELYRRQRISVPTADFTRAYVIPAAQPDAFEVMTVAGGQIRSLSDLTIPPGTTVLPQFAGRYVPARFGAGGFTAAPVFAPIANTSARFVEDKLMSSVLSFEVKFTGNATGVTWPTQYPANPDYPYDTLPFNGMFDTHSPYVNWQADIGSAANTNGRLKPIRITGAQVRVRTFEVRTRTTRQTTFTVDL